MIARWVVAIMTFTVLGICAAQPANHDLELARQHFVHGKQLAGENHFSDAYDEFALGYGLSGRPTFLFNMAECRRALGDGRSAHELYERYLAMDPQGELAPIARARIAEQSSAAASPPPAAAPLPPAEAARVTVSVQDPTTVRIPSPAVAASTIVTPPSSTSVLADPPSRPLWRRPAVWIGVGTALIAGSIAIYAVTRHGPQCTPPTCVMPR